MNQKKNKVNPELVEEGNNKEQSGNYQRQKENRKISNQQPTLQLKELKLKEKTKPKASRRKEMVNIRAEISEIEKRKTIEKNQ